MGEQKKMKALFLKPLQSSKNVLLLSRSPVLGMKIWHEMGCIGGCVGRICFDIDTLDGLD